MKKFLLATSALCLALQTTAAPAQVAHDDKTVLDMLEDTRPCVFFRLNGVTIADPAIGGDWFVIPRSHIAFAELFAMLLTARVMHLTVYVHTTGATACGGVVEVDKIYIKS
jgi:hypothetical protein